MKSPLVEALRQASDKKSADGAPDPATPETAPATTAPLQTDSDGLALLETMEILPIDRVDEQAGNDSEPVGLDDDALAEMPPSGTDRAVQPAGPMRAAAAGPGARDALARLGLYTPLICLLLASATAALHVLYRSAASSLGGSPVATMPVRAHGESADSATPGGNRFPLLRAADTVPAPDGEELLAGLPEGRPE